MKELFIELQHKLIIEQGYKDLLKTSKTDYYTF